MSRGPTGTLGLAGGSATTRPSTPRAEKVKFIGVTDTGIDGVGFEDTALGDRVKLKAKLVLPKHGCEGEVLVEVKKIKVKRPAATESD